MSQPKKSSPQPSAKLASQPEGRSQAENVVRMSNVAMKDFISNSAGEAQKAQDKMMAMSRDGAEQLAKSADACAKLAYESVAIARDNIEACMECSSLASAMAQEMSAECFESASRGFSDCMEMSKELMACRTFNDMFDWQNRAVKNCMENFFNQCNKMSGMAFEYASEAMEPINQRMSQTSEQIGKAFAA
jgi:hypothetical protein